MPPNTHTHPSLCATGIIFLNSPRNHSQYTESTSIPSVNSLLIYKMLWKQIFKTSREFNYINRLKNNVFSSLWQHLLNIQIVPTICTFASKPKAIALCDWYEIHKLYEEPHEINRKHVHRLNVYHKRVLDVFSTLPKQYWKRQQTQMTQTNQQS